MANFSKNNIRSVFFALPLLLIAEPALAVQHHGGTEGLISHQIGHLLFTIGIIFLLFRVYKNNHKEPGWFEFRGFLWFIILWNFLTFSGHWLYEFTKPSSFTIVNNHPIAFTITNVTGTLFYITRFDHFLLVPALFLLLRALYKWGQAS